MKHWLRSHTRAIFWCLYLIGLVIAGLLIVGCANMTYPETLETRTCPQNGIQYELARITPEKFSRLQGYQFGGRAAASVSQRRVVARNDLIYTDEDKWHECEHLAGRDHDYGTRTHGQFKEERIPGEVQRIIAAQKRPN